MNRTRFGLAILLTSAAISTEAAIVSTFDTSLEGWTWNNNGAIVQHIPSGGNPGGYFRIEDDAPDVGMRAFAPSMFLGDLGGLDNGVLSMDLRIIITPQINQAEFYGTVDISGGGLLARNDLVIGPPSTSWTTYQAPLTAEEWGVTEAEWAILLRGVTNITIHLEAGGGRRG